MELPKKKWAAFWVLIVLVYTPDCEGKTMLVNSTCQDTVKRSPSDLVWVLSDPQTSELPETCQWTFTIDPGDLLLVNMEGYLRSANHPEKICLTMKDNKTDNYILIKHQEGQVKSNQEWCFGNRLSISYKARRCPEPDDTSSLRITITGISEGEVLCDKDKPRKITCQDNLIPKIPVQSNTNCTGDFKDKVSFTSSTLFSLESTASVSKAFSEDKDTGLTRPVEGPSSTSSMTSESALPGRTTTGPGLGDGIVYDKLETSGRGPAVGQVIGQCECSNNGWWINLTVINLAFCAVIILLLVGAFIFFMRKRQHDHEKMLTQVKNLIINLMNQQQPMRDLEQATDNTRTESQLELRSVSQRALHTRTRSQDSVGFSRETPASESRGLTESRGSLSSAPERLFDSPIYEMELSSDLKAVSSPSNTAGYTKPRDHVSESDASGPSRAIQQRSLPCTPECGPPNNKDKKCGSCQGKDPSKNASDSHTMYENIPGRTGGSASSLSNLPTVSDRTGLASTPPLMTSSPRTAGNKMHRPVSTSGYSGKPRRGSGGATPSSQNCSAETSKTCTASQTCPKRETGGRWKNPC